MVTRLPKLVREEFMDTKMSMGNSMSMSMQFHVLPIQDDVCEHLRIKSLPNQYIFSAI